MVGRWRVAGIVSAALALAARDGRAQAGRPVVAAAAPVPAGQDTITPPTTRDAQAIEPLRLHLLAPYVPHAYATPGCESANAGAATGIAMFPGQGTAAIGVSPFGYGAHAPRLTLFGFSRGGCAIDSAIGGGAALSIPITKDIFFAWSGGAIYLPQNQGPYANKGTEMRADIVFQRSGGRAYTVGVGTLLGGPHVSFGGIF